MVRVCARSVPPPSEIVHTCLLFYKHHNVTTMENEGTQQWATILATSVALLVISATVFVVGAPVWRELVQEPRARERARRLEAARVEEEVKDANEWLQRKQQKSSEAYHADQTDVQRTESTTHIITPPETAAKEEYATCPESDASQPKAQSECMLPSESMRPPGATVRGTTCWGCGATGGGFKACSKCVALELEEPCVFCSSACLASAWPRHKTWHASLKPTPDEAEREQIKAALRAVEQSEERIAVPVKRPTRRRPATKAGKDQGPKVGEDRGEQSIARGASAVPSSAVEAHQAKSDYDAQLERAEAQQRARERSQLARAFEQLAEKLQRDNPGRELEAARDNFGKLVVQIEALVSSDRHGEAVVEELFRREAVNGTVHMLDFLAKESTLDWFLALPETYRPQ